MKKVISKLSGGESVCLCSAYKMGDRRLIDYVYHTLARDGEYELLYDEDGTLKAEDIRRKIAQSKGTVTVILLPSFPYKNMKFRRSFDELSYMHKKDIRTVVLVHPDFLESPETYFSRSVSPVSYVMVRKPFNLKMTRSLIETRRFLNGWIVPESLTKQIYRLSGGNPGLIKRLCSYADEHSDLDVVELLAYPPIVLVLAGLKVQIDTLSRKSCLTLGLIDEDGNVRGTLLREYVGGSDMFGISEQQSRLLKLFLRRKNAIVSIDDIGDCLGYGDEFSMWGMYQAVGRLKDAVRGKYVIENVRAKGYVLRDS